MYPWIVTPPFQICIYATVSSKTGLTLLMLHVYQRGFLTRVNCYTGEDIADKQQVGEQCSRGFNGRVLYVQQRRFLRCYRQPTDDQPWSYPNIRSVFSHTHR